MTSEQRSVIAAAAKLVNCNPFLPERIEFEHEALGADFHPEGSDWNRHAESAGHHPNIDHLLEKSEEIARTVRKEIARADKATQREYEELVILILYYRYRNCFPEKLILNPGVPGEPLRVYDDFSQRAEFFLKQAGIKPSLELPHLFACFFQVRRAFHHIFTNLIGGSECIARLRAATWQSIFTHDLRRYRRLLYERMGDLTTLIIGPSGTGKELVARAIALSRYLPFDPRTQKFGLAPDGLFQPLNISALPATLVESELFGHKRGAYTGALQDQAGWLEMCPACGTVFLDEIGEIEQSIQVKLLRVLQDCTFQRLGETKLRRFNGKIIAATNRDLGEEMRAGSFRQDFYYRLCSDVIMTPSLHEQIRERPEELRELVTFVTKRLAGESESTALTDEVMHVIEKHLGANYIWPGNFRELEQCVRNVLVRKEYTPPRARSATTQEELARDVCAGSLTVDELLSRYCSLVHAQTDNFEETARRLNVDRRTVKARVQKIKV